MAQTKSNLPKKSITNKSKIKNKKVNKLELTVRDYMKIRLKPKLRHWLLVVLKLMIVRLNVNETD